MVTTKKLNQIQSFIKLKNIKEKKKKTLKDRTEAADAEREIEN